MEANTERYKNIVENTVNECNRVLSVWKQERKTPLYGSEVAMFRGFLSRFVRHEFGHRYGIRISNTNPYCIVRNNKVVGMTIHNIPSNSYAYSKEINGLCDYIRAFDFEAFNNKVPEVVSELDNINFDEIKNIKF